VFGGDVSRQPLRVGRFVSPPSILSGTRFIVSGPRHGMNKSVVEMMGQVVYLSLRLG
jgi:hypothetical protein